MIDWSKPTGLIVGRFQPFHDGHKALILEALAREGQVLVGIRRTFGSDENNPLDEAECRRRIEAAFAHHPQRDKIELVVLPNVTGIYYGRDVGYKVEKLELGAATESISATKLRREMRERAG